MKRVSAAFMDDSALLAALQLADSFFPSGMVSLSHGLETFVSLSSDTDIRRLLEDYLRHKVAPLELLAYLHAYRAAEAADLERLHEVDRALSASLLPQELRRASARSGRAMLETLRPSEDAVVFRAFTDGVDRHRSQGNGPVCLAVVCVGWQVPQRAGGIVLLHSFMVSFVSAALRLGSLGHRQAQAILRDLRPQLSALVDMVWQRELDEMGSFAPLADIRAMQHASLPVRLFSS